VHHLTIASTVASKLAGLVVALLARVAGVKLLKNEHH